MSGMRLMFSAALAALALVLSSNAGARVDDPRAREIMEKADVRDTGDNGTSDMEMVLIDRHGKQRLRRIKTFSKDFGEDTYRLMFFLHPADVRDTSFLTYDYDDPERDDDQWLYLPALKKTKRIASSDRSGSFMGSDFNYSDMTSRDLEDYDFKLLREMEVEGSKTWLIESLPRRKDVEDETGYSKSWVFVRQDNYVVARAVHWVSGSERLKYMDVKRLELIDGIWVSTETHMTTRLGRETMHRTVLRLENVRFNQNLEEGLFTVRRMEKGL